MKGHFYIPIDEKHPDPRLPFVLATLRGSYTDDEPIEEKKEDENHLIICIEPGFYYGEIDEIEHDRSGGFYWKDNARAKHPSISITDFITQFPIDKVHTKVTYTMSNSDKIDIYSPHEVSEGFLIHKGNSLEFIDGFINGIYFEKIKVYKSQICYALVSEPNFDWTTVHSRIQTNR
ncbi:MAG: hypothetical protein ABI002_14600 [Saprospiraceae bacterium]